MEVAALAGLLAVQPAPVAVPDAAEQRLPQLGHGDDRLVREQQPVELGVDVAVMGEDSDALAGRVRPLRGGVQQALGEDQQRARRAGVGLHQRPRRLDVEAAGLVELRPCEKRTAVRQTWQKGRMQGRCLCTHL